MSILLLQAATQIVSDTTNAVANGAAKSEPLSVISLIIKGGWVMVPLGILLLLTIYFITERYITIRRASRVDPNFMNNIRDYVTNGKTEAALDMCQRTNTPIARLLQKGLKRMGRPIKEIESAVENTGKLEIYKLERNMSYLGIISGIAPMVGFVGTIAGVIKIFYSISITPGFGINDIAGGLYVKMITSASGLIVGIIAHIGFHYLNAMIDRVSYQIESTAVEFIDLLNEPSR